MINRPNRDQVDPRRRPVPAVPPDSPFGPGDSSVLDADEVQAKIEATRQALLDAQRKLNRLRYGPGPDNQDPPLREVTRADGQWPFLLIRSYPGDVGGRPLPQGMPTDQSPDIIVTPADPAAASTIVDRTEIAALKARDITQLSHDQALDVWVHVWNLGRSQATGVRVRVRLLSMHALGLNGDYLGGATVDLDDRLGTRAHRAVKVVSFNAPPDSFWDDSFALLAEAECLSDPVTARTPLPHVIIPGTDRHAAHRLFTLL
jgi:hypothetical protein